MPTKKNAIYRADLLVQHMNAGKQGKVCALLKAWRQSAELLARHQWKLFFSTGKLDNYDKSKTGFTPVGGTYGQMVRWKVVGQLEPWMSNRFNDFRELVKLIDSVKQVVEAAA